MAEIQVLIGGYLTHIQGDGGGLVSTDFGRNSWEDFRLTLEKNGKLHQVVIRFNEQSPNFTIVAQAVNFKPLATA